MGTGSSNLRMVLRRATPRIAILRTLVAQGANMNMSQDASIPGTTYYNTSLSTLHL